LSWTDFRTAIVTRLSPCNSKSVTLSFRYYRSANTAMIGGERNTVEMATIMTHNPQRIHITTHNCT
jgi:hypothetical protein